MRLGLPYQGSKNRIADWILSVLPKATHFYDLFAGGCAITHAALLSGRYGVVHFSDTNDSVVLFRDCLEGNIPDGSEWISREEFYRRKDTDVYVRLVWSFSNNQRDYIYSREIEPYKKAVHEMIFAPTPNERRLKFKEVCRLLPFVLGGGYETGRQRGRRALSEAAYRLQSAEAITPPNTASNGLSAILRGPSAAQHRGSKPPREYGGGGNRPPSDGGAPLGGGENRPFRAGEYEMRVADYREIEILPDSVVYCDIPYKDARLYKHDTFDHEAFYDWCGRQRERVFISEYSMPEDRFVCVAQRERTSTFSATNNSLKKIEKIFVPIHQYNPGEWRETRQLTLF